MYIVHVFKILKRMGIFIKQKRGCHRFEWSSKNTFKQKSSLAGTVTTVSFLRALCVQVSQAAQCTPSERIFKNQVFTLYVI